MNKIALIFDWDLTLSPYYMQRPVFERYGVDEGEFWSLVHDRTKRNIQDLKGIRCYCELEYLQLMLEFVSNGKFKGLNTATLAEQGKQIKLYPAVPNFFGSLKAKYPNVEFYIVSSGVISLLRNHPLTSYIPVENIYASDFADKEVIEKGRKVKQLGRITSLVTPWDKPRIMEGIVKGCRSENPYESFTPTNDIIPRSNIFYIGDGISDIYAFQKVKEFGGYAVGILNDRNFKNIEAIRQLGILDIVCQPNYREESLLYSWISAKIQEINQKEDNYNKAKSDQLSKDWLKL